MKMKRHASGVAIAILTFTVGTVTMSEVRKQDAKHQVMTMTQPLPRVATPQVKHPPHPLSPAELLSPYALASFISRNEGVALDDVWQQLGINSQLLATCGNCKAEIFEVELDGEPGTEVLLRVADDLQVACRYLIFNEADTDSAAARWKLLGHIDHDVGRYRMPQHSIVVSSGQSLLVVQVQEGSGSGFSLFYDRLFQVQPDGVKELFSYPSNGRFSAGHEHSPFREFMARIVNTSKSDFAEVEVEFTVFCRGRSQLSDKEIALFKKKQRAVYVKQRGAESYALDTSRSDLSERELKDMYDGEWIADEDFLRYNHDELFKLAASKDVRRRAWFHVFLQTSGLKPEFKRLTRLQ